MGISIKQDLLMFKRMHLLLSLVLVLPALIVCEGGGGDGMNSVEVFRHDVLVKINELRGSIKIGTLTRDADLEANAQMWANFLTKDPTCKYFHQSPLPTIVRAENLAVSVGQMTGEMAVNDWGRFPTKYRFNMEDKEYTR